MSGLKSMRKFIVIIGFVLAVTGYCQTLPTSFGSLIDFQRRTQLLLDSGQFSFAIRPIQLDTLSTSLWSRNYQIWRFPLTLTVLPWLSKFEFNSNHARVENNGAMVRSGGLQHLHSVGVNIRTGKLEIQLRPELRYLPNKVYNLSLIHI